MYGGASFLDSDFLVENWYFVPPDTHTYVCVSGDKKCCFSEDFAYVLNEWFRSPVKGSEFEPTLSHFDQIFTGLKLFFTDINLLNAKLAII